MCNLPLSALARQETLLACSWTMPSFPAVGSSSSYAPSITPHIFRRKSPPPYVLPIYFPSSPFFSLFSTAAAGSSPEEESQLKIQKKISHRSRLEETVGIESEKSRLDVWISSRVPGVSRARIQSSIRLGLVTVNGRKIDKVSHIIKPGDSVNCVVSELQLLNAEPEDIPIDIVYEDSHLLVVNKPAHMVVHPAPGNACGTLVNAILHHCNLPEIPFKNRDKLSKTENVSEETDDENDNIFAYSKSNPEVSVRPGIVHRLDKGTSGLLVVAKDEHSHSGLAEQFKCHTIHRVYVSLTCGVPSPKSGRVDVPIARDSNNRIRMAAVPGPSKNGYARQAASRYRVLEILAAGGSALVEWKLETGRTHQIRAHAKYLGIPLLGDEVYGGTKSLALSLLRPKVSPSYHGELSSTLSTIDRPCLHALSLGFRHPHTGEDVKFSCPPPSDFSKLLFQLRNISNEKVHYKQTSS